MKTLNNRKFIELLRMMAGQNNGGFGEVFREAARRLEEAKPVLCMHCKHWDVDPDTYGDALGPKGTCFGICDGANMTKQDDYCSCGERRD